MSQIHRLPYAVLRYHYDPARDEGVNVGVLFQTETGLVGKFVEDWGALYRAYPFLELTQLRRKLESLRALVSQDRFRVYDYDRNRALELSANDPRLLAFLRREINHDVQLTEQRFAELATVTDSQVSAVLDYLYETLVDPPEPKLGQMGREILAEARPPKIRRAHAALHRAATRAILRAARRVVPKSYYESGPVVTGSTRPWKFDLRFLPAAHYIQHILVLPDLEETMMDTAAVARIWQDVSSRHHNAKLTAVYYSENGFPEDARRDGQKLLAKDRIETIYVDEIQGHYSHLLGQKHLFPKSSSTTD